MANAENNLSHFTEDEWVIIAELADSLFGGDGRLYTALGHAADLIIENTAPKE